MNKIKNQDSTVYLIPILLILILVPTFVYMKDIQQSELAAKYWHGRKVAYDFFCYYKTLILRSLTIVSLLFYATQKWLYGFRFSYSKELKYLIIFSGFALISTLFSDFPEFAWLGFPDRFEGFFSFMSYLIIMYITYDLSTNLRSIKIFLKTLLIITVGMSIIGLFQYFYMDLFQSQFGRWLILPAKYLKYAEQLKFHQSNPVYMTLYQSNITGSFLAMIFPMSLMSVFLFQNRSRIILLIANILIFSVWVACDSRAGWVGALVSLVLTIFFYRKKFISFVKTHQKIILLLVCSYILVIGGLRLKPTSTIFNRLSKYMETTQAPSEDLQITELKVEKNQINIVTNFHQIIIKKEQDQFNFYDQSGRAYQVQPLYKNTFTFHDDKLKDVEMSYFKTNKGEIVLQYNFKKRPFLAFTYILNHFVYYDLTRKEIIEPTEVPYFPTKAFDKLASNRGYIWTRTIPLFKDTIFIGKGFDTFPVYFPRHDYVDKSQVWSGTYILVEKPHSFYLETILNVGFLGFVSIMIFFYFFYKRSFSYLQTETKNTESKNYLKMIIPGLIGFMTSLFFNDSLVSVSTVFWILIGLSLRLLENQTTPKKA